MTQFQLETSIDGELFKIRELSVIEDIHVVGVDVSKCMSSSCDRL